MAAPWRAISSPTSTCSALVRDLDRELIASTSIFASAGDLTARRGGSARRSPGSRLLGAGGLRPGLELRRGVEAGGLGEPHGSLDVFERVGIACGEQARSFPGAGERVVDELERQAVGDGGIGVQRLALEQNAQRALTADRPGQEVGAAAAGMEADAGERRAEARSGSHEAEVADEREVQARAYCGSLDRRDRRDLQVEDAEEAAVVGVQRVAEFADRSLEI